eukprot:3047212-Pleurochrysis_carterae.AAC.2
MLQLGCEYSLRADTCVSAFVRLMAGVAVMICEHIMPFSVPLTASPLRAFWPQRFTSATLMAEA